jgi:hypothetical protein
VSLCIDELWTWKVSSLWERLSTVGVWGDPKQMTGPSAVATTTVPLATAREAVTGEAASYSQTFLPLARSSP